jgi:hypothetical protein
MKKKYQIIIQKKIDGVLSASEEEQFDELIKTSPEARSFYQKVAILHHTLEFDSGHIPEIDFSDQIIQALEHDRIIRRPFLEKVQHFYVGNRRQILAYAAILMIGLIFGSVATYLGISQVKMPDAEVVSGTIAKPTGDGYTFNQAGTGIKIQNFKSDDFRMLIVDIETIDTVLCTIRDGQVAESSGNVKLLFTKGNFQIAKKDEGGLSYLCNGKNVFLVNNVDSFNMGSISFSRKDKLIFEYKTNQGRE